MKWEKNRWKRKIGRGRGRSVGGGSEGVGAPCEESSNGKRATGTEMEYGSRLSRASPLASPLASLLASSLVVA